jgi:KAP family P-loop domain
MSELDTQRHSDADESGAELERFSPAVQEVLGWAVASEVGGAVGSRGVLIGIIRAREKDSEPDQLLRHFEVSRSALFKALQKERPQVPIEPEVPSPAPVTAPPRLTSNAREALELAERLAFSTGPDGEADVRHVFGALLQITDSTASKALAKVLSPVVPLQKISESYPDYLNVADRVPYEEFLREHFRRVAEKPPEVAEAPRKRPRNRQPEPPPKLAKERTAKPEPGPRTKQEPQPAGEGTTKAGDNPTPDPSQANGARPSTAITTDAWTDRDQLEHELYADAIAKFVLDAKTKAPLTIGIKAPWGAGKTSLMRMIRKRLDPEAPNGRRPVLQGPRLTIWQVLRNTWRHTPAEAASELEPEPPEPTARRTTIWFNAWKYQSSEQLWAGLAHAILSQASDRMPPLARDRLWASLQVRRVKLPELRRSFYRYLAVRLLPYALVVPLVAIGVLLAWMVDPSLLRGASIAGAILTGVTAAAGIVRSATDEVTKAVPDLVEEPDYESRLGFLHLVESDMHRILDIAGATQQRPFVVFVDDLDRCSYGTVAQVIEALNVFLAGDFDNCIFVIAMEPDLVAAQIHVAYEKLFQQLEAGTETDLGWRFLEKMVQLPLALPEPQRPEVERFVTAILGSDSEAQVAELDDDAPEVVTARKQIRRAETTNSLEGIPVAMAKVRSDAQASTTAPANLEAVLQKAARLEFVDRFSDAHARDMLVRHAADLSGNPREIKRFINVFRFYAYVDFWRKTQDLKTPGLDGAAKLARIAIGWPSLLSALAKDVSQNGREVSLLAWLEEAADDDKAWKQRLKLAPERTQAVLARSRDLRRIIGNEPRVGANASGFL